MNSLESLTNVMPRAYKKKPLEGEVLPKRGRPSSYRDTYNEDIINLFEAGGDVPEFCAKANIAESTFYNWRKDHPEFNEAFGIADAKAKSFYINALKSQGLSTTKFPNSSQLHTYIKQRWPETFGKPGDTTGATTNITINSIDSLPFTELFKQVQEDIKRINYIKSE